MNSTPASIDESVFAHRSFTRLWFARVATIMAYQMLTVAVGWQIYALTGSALHLGLVGLVQFLPAFALVLVVGHIADRFDRRRILCACQGVALVAVAILAAGSAMGWVTEQVIFALVFVIGCARAFEMPTIQALLPALKAAAIAAPRGSRPVPRRRKRRSSWVRQPAGSSMWRDQAGRTRRARRHISPP